MKTMTSKDIKNHFGTFVETARRERVEHTYHGRRILVTMPVAEADALDALQRSAALDRPEDQPRKPNKILELAGKWQHLGRFDSDQDVVDSIRKLRDEGP
jgi:hypothetical protein